MPQIKGLIARIAADRSGASAAEYALLLGLLAGSVAMASWALGQSITGVLNDSATLVARYAGASSATPGAGSSSSPPGNSGSAPGQNGTTPGQSGSNPASGSAPPGQSGTNPGQSGSNFGQSKKNP